MESTSGCKIQRQRNHPIHTGHISLSTQSTHMLSNSSYAFCFANGSPKSRTSEASGRTNTSDGTPAERSLDQTGSEENRQNMDTNTTSTLSFRCILSSMC